MNGCIMTYGDKSDMGANRSQRHNPLLIPRLTHFWRDNSSYPFPIRTKFKVMAIGAVYLFGARLQLNGLNEHPYF